jgi:predicted SAM-dependent methyltransferase
MKKQNHKIYKTINEIVKAYPNGIERLEIGSGSNPEPGYVHLDIQADLPDLDILSDVRNMPLPDNFVSGEIRAVHIMEHFCHPEFGGDELAKQYGTTLDVIKEVYRVLKPGGKFKIVTPDLEKIGVSIAKNRIPMDWLQRWCVGGHNDEYDVHHWLWTKSDAEKWFAQVGFIDLNDWNPYRGLKKYLLNWTTNDKQGNMEWHRIEWYHWLFFEGVKP